MCSMSATARHGEEKKKRGGRRRRQHNLFLFSFPGIFCRSDSDKPGLRQVTDQGTAVKGSSLEVRAGGGRSLSGRTVVLSLLHGWAGGAWSPGLLLEVRCSLCRSTVEIQRIGREDQWSCCRRAGTAEGR